jgi:peptide chain release factor subunit 1
MQTSDLTLERLRALAETRPERGRVLSLYLNLDPSELPTPPARESAVRSLLDRAHRKITELGAGHEDAMQLRADLERARGLLEGGLPAEGAHGLALFACGAVGLFEVVRLPRAVTSCVAVDRTPQVEPLAELLDATSWAVLLVNRRYARILRGSRDALRELSAFADDVHGQHDQGGLSQARYERSVEEDVDEHLKVAADALFSQFKRRPFDALLVGAPEELVGRVEDRLHPYLRERLAGHVTVDVEHASPDDVLGAASAAIAAHERARVHEVLARLRRRLGGGGPASAGWDDVLSALNERRVEALLLADGHPAGVACPRCGWLGTGAECCPVDATALERLDDIAEGAVEAALGQRAEVVRVEREDLADLGGVGAVLRF